MSLYSANSSGDVPQTLSAAVLPMSAARRGAIAATVQLAGLVALLLSPGASRAERAPIASTGSRSILAAKTTSTTTTTTSSQSCVKPILGSACAPLSTTDMSSTTTQLSSASTLSYAVLPGNVSIPPTATPKPAPTPAPTPAATTDIGASAIGSDTATTTTQASRATTVINPQPGGDSSSVLPLTVLALLVLVGGGAIFLVTRLR
ncbi:MAG: hypothetical protein QOG45_82 [Chloroflexota bacterium]|nr:hypothetical protein [Chloroflexota bacterium]